MIRFKDDKAAWTPRINGGRFRSRIVCVRSSTSDIPTHTHAHTHLHPPFPLWKSSLRETYFRVPSDFSASLRREGGGGAFERVRGESCFFLSPLSSDFSVPRSFPIGNSITPWMVFRVWTITWKGGRGTRTVVILILFSCR